MQPSIALKWFSELLNNDDGQWGIAVVAGAAVVPACLGLYRKLYAISVGYGFSVAGAAGICLTACKLRSHPNALPAPNDSRSWSVTPWTVNRSMNYDTCDNHVSCNYRDFSQYGINSNNNGGDNANNNEDNDNDYTSSNNNIKDNSSNVITI
eukprot:scaffold411565_cov35-Prasinocladus_malaysianus.AAC.1